MDALEASSLAECIEYEVGAGEDAAHVECFAVPLRPGSSRRTARWAYLLVTDVTERVLRESLGCMELEVVERRGSHLVVMAWPRGRPTEAYTAGAP